MLFLTAAQQAENYIDEYGLDSIDGFQSLTPDELKNLGLSMLKARTVSDAYDLMAAPPSDGSISYYDRLIAEPQHLDTYKILDRTLRKAEPTRVKTAIDIATGTGFCAKLLSQVAEHVTAVDTSPGLLRVASRELETLRVTGKYMKSFDVAQMNALQLEYSDGSFDIVVSNALTHYLTFDEQQAFYKEIHRILAPRGRYYEPQQNGASSGSYYGLSPRGKLAQEVAKIPLLARDPTKFPNGTKNSIPDMGEYGFDYTRVVYQTEPFVRQVVRAVKI